MKRRLIRLRITVSPHEISAVMPDHGPRIGVRFGRKFWQGRHMPPECRKSGEQSGFWIKSKFGDANWDQPLPTPCRFVQICLHIACVCISRVCIPNLSFYAPIRLKGFLVPPFFLSFFLFFFSSPFHFRPDLMVSSIVQPPVHVVTYAIYVQQSMYKYG